MVVGSSRGEGHGNQIHPLAWYEQSGFTEGDFGVADVLARAKTRAWRAGSMPASWPPPAAGFASCGPTSSTPPGIPRPTVVRSSRWAVRGRVRAGRDAGRIADEVFSSSRGIVGASVTVTLEIEASIPDGAPENVVRVFDANARDLRFEAGSRFETE